METLPALMPSSNYSLIVLLASNLILVAARCMAQADSTPDCEPLPLLEYHFNEIGISAPSFGFDSTSLTLRDILSTPSDLHSNDGGGVSGRLGDRSFDNSGSKTMGFSTNPNDIYSRNGGVADAPPIDAINGLLSLTLQGWLKCDSSPLARAVRLIDTGGAFGLNGLDTGILVFHINDTTAQQRVQTANQRYAETNQWFFFAVTFDGSSSTNNVLFYKGLLNSPVNLIETHTFAPTAIRQTNTHLRIGNTDVPNGANPGRNDRPFDGWMDNLRIFGSPTNASGALTQNALERLRINDTLNINDSPLLTVSSSNGLVTITWPIYPGGFTLEFSQDLTSPATWQSVGPKPTLTNCQNVMTLSLTTTRFFRLRR